MSDLMIRWVWRSSSTTPGRLPMSVCFRWRCVRAMVDGVEVLGSGTSVHCSLSIPPVITPEIEELPADSGSDLSSLGDVAELASRASADVAVSSGKVVRLVADPAETRFSDKENGERIGFSDRTFEMV